MNHAILGAGGVGGLIGAALVHQGESVTLILRPETFSSHPDELWLESPFGNIKAPVRRATTLPDIVDVLWVTVKATQLEAALGLIPPTAQAKAIVPLLNGIDHVRLLRSRYGQHRIVPGTIAVESERVAPGHIVHRSPFARVVLAEGGRERLHSVADRLRAFGLTCEFQSDESTILWGKLVFLAPLALTTTAAMKNKGEIFADPAWHARLRSCVDEACAVARAYGAKVEAEKTWALVEGLPAHIRSSMQKDVVAGRLPELDAIAGPILRGGNENSVNVPVTQELVARVKQRIK